jgi:hypothetical protein
MDYKALVLRVINLEDFVKYVFSTLVELRLLEIKVFSLVFPLSSGVINHLAVS